MSPGVPLIVAPHTRRFGQGLWLFLSMVVVPLAALTLWLLFITSDRYRTTCRLAIRSTTTPAPSADGLPMLFSMGLGQGATESERLLAYIRSPDLAIALAQDAGLRNHWQTASADWWSRLPSKASREDYLETYGQYLTAASDPLSGTVTVELQTFSAVEGQRILSALIDEAETFLNETSRQVAHRRLQFLQGELTQAEIALASARKAAMAYQAGHGLLDPLTSVGAHAARIAAFEDALSKERTTVRELRSYLSADSPEVRVAESRITALLAQMADERTAAVGTGEGSLVPVVSGYATLVIAQEFALEKYRTLLVATEQARVEAQQAATALMAIERPLTAEEPAYPRRWYILLSTAAVLLALWALVRLMLATVREHQDN